MKKNDFTKNWLFYKKGSEEKQRINLPHDAMIHEKRSAEAESGSAGGFFPGGVYCYEKTIENVDKLQGRHVEILFEGVYHHAKIYLNDELVGEHAYGYTPFTVALDGKLKSGQENVLRVEADNSQMPNSRWYTGSGIYRPVYLYVSEPVHICQNGIKVQTRSINPAIVQVAVEHTGMEADEVEIHILDGNEIIGTSSGCLSEMELCEASLWDEENPKLYHCHVILKRDGQTLDEAETEFGIRMVTWDTKGLYINGRETLLKGACVHHDNGILGACSYDVSEERRVRKLKAAGYNAIRSSHNPASIGMLGACDKLGMYVIDETWDVWYNKKNTYDYSNVFMEHYREDIENIVNRDFNHPSVIMYSIGNEVSEPAQEKGVELAKEMVQQFHKLDATRAVTGGINLMIINKSAEGNAVYKEDGSRDDSKEKQAVEMTSTMFNQMTAMIGTGMNMAANGEPADKVTAPVLDALDIAGYNYASGRYPLEGEAHPDRIIFGSETFPQDIAKNWKMVEKYPYLIGDFMWTAWDYLGEAGIGAWAYTEDGREFNKPYPWLLADVGAFDILGNPNGELFLAEAVWGMITEPKIAVQPVNHPGEEPAKAVWRGTNAIPSWSWSGCEGNHAVVEVYGDGAEAELVRNGVSVGRKKVEDYCAVFETEYQPGILEAVIYDADGRENGRNCVVSAKEDLHMKLHLGNEKVLLGQPVYVNLSIQDTDGTVECNCDQRIKVTVTGGKLLAYGSANPRTEEAFDTGEYTTYYGKGQIVVTKDEIGELKITAECRKFGTETLNIVVTQ